MKDEKKKVTESDANWAAAELQVKTDMPREVITEAIRIEHEYRKEHGDAAWAKIWRGQ